MDMAQRGCCFHLPRRTPTLLLVVEKECVLRTLLHLEDALQRHVMIRGCSHALILVCTKGYPCRATRLWLRRLHCALPRVPLLALVDGDVHGMSMVLTLMGLMGRSERRACARRDLLPICWAGVRTSAHYGARAQRAALPAALLRALTPADHTRLATLRGLLEGVPCEGGEVVEGERMCECVGDGNANANADAAVVRRTLNEVYEEVCWMERVKLKCEIEQATQGCGVLPYVEAYMRCASAAGSSCGMAGC